MANKIEKLQETILNKNYSVAIKRVKEYGFTINYAVPDKGNIEIKTEKGNKTLKCLPL
jgi:hypothetical protein